MRHFETVTKLINNVRLLNFRLLFNVKATRLNTIFIIFLKLDIFVEIDINFSFKWKRNINLIMT